MGSGRSARWARRVVTLLLLAPRLLPGQVQQTMPTRALELEQAGKLREAVAAYREALSEATVIPVMLGLERVYSQLGRSDSLLPLLDTVLARRPRDPQLRAIQLRTLTSLNRDDEASAAFERWVALSPRDPAPYREYARQLLDDGHTARADTILQRALRALGTTRDLTVEMAQLRAALGLWEPSARSWRDAAGNTTYLEQAAVFSLLPAPNAARPAVRAVFLAAPLDLTSRRILAALELRWHSAREGWLALSDIPASDSAVRAWVDFAEQAEEVRAWLPARDALSAALARKPTQALAVRAATDALNGNDARSALSILETLGGPADSERARTVLPLQVRALSAVGRPADAVALIATYGATVDAGARGALQRQIAWGWVRAGDLVKAREALAAAGQSAGSADDRTAGWIALYEGDLAGARLGLRRTVENSGDLVLALSLLARTKADTARSVGRAFLALAKGDSAQAAAEFALAGDSVADAAPLLLAAAARINAAAHHDQASLELWQRIAAHYAAAPESAEAELEWARALLRAGDAASAVARFEHMILTYPQSALVPQARRELDVARGSAPTH
jgi:tetratricopeptide (TPR) repeat protein